MNIDTIKTNGMTMRYFCFGSENGKPLVILAGVALKSVMESAELIAQQFAPLAESFRIYVPDRREDLPEQYSISGMADDTVKAMDFLGIGGAVIYGVSQGGMIAQEIAIRRPDLTDRVVLCSTAPYIPESSAKLLGNWADLAEKGDTEGLIQAFGEEVYSAGYFGKYRSAFDALGRALTAHDLHRFSVTVRSGSGFDVTECLARVKCPFLVIAGDRDRIFDASLSAMIAEHTNGELRVLSGQPHAVYDESPEVLSMLKEFAEK